MSPIDVVVVGAGQAGLSASHELTRHGIDHVVLERQHGSGGRWGRRWDSFCLVTINENCRLPGFAYDGDDPEGFMARDEIVAYLDRYAARFAPPVEYGVNVAGVGPGPGHDRWRVSTSAGEVTARHVIIAAGPFQHPKLPDWAPSLPGISTQIHAEHYRSPEQLPDGAALVVGTGQSGTQIAEELHESGRAVYLGVSRCGRRPRRYRGRDTHAWVALARQAAIEHDTLRTVHDLDSPAERFVCNPHLSGKRGGHEINLRELAARGVILLGRPIAIRDQTLLLAGDLIANLERADVAAELSRRTIDKFIADHHIDAPEETVARNHYPDPPILTKLDLDLAGITTVIWATGYRLDFSWIDVPNLSDAYGYPWHERGITPHPGLVFLGLPWLHSEASSLLLGMENRCPLPRRKHHTLLQLNLPLAQQAQSLVHRDPDPSD
jgi:putative flavoprotein involved in K+ transport